MTFFQSEQLYQKNNLLKAYEQQNSQLRSMINRQKTSQFLKLPKEGSMIATVKLLEYQNQQLKKKLNESIEANIELVNKAQKEKIFNRKLEKENDELKKRLGEASRLSQAEISAKFVENVMKGMGNYGMVGNMQQGFVNSGNIKQQQPFQLSNIFSSLFSQQPTNSQPSLPNQDLVIRALSMHRDKLQSQQQISYLKNELQKCQQQLQIAQKQVRSLKQKVLQLQQMNHSTFVLMQNDKLAGDLLQERLVREALQMEMRKVSEEFNKKEQEIQLLRQSFEKRMVQQFVGENIKERKSVRNSSSKKQIPQNQRSINIEKQKSINMNQDKITHQNQHHLASRQNSIHNELFSHQYDFNTSELIEKNDQSGRKNVSRKLSINSLMKDQNQAEIKAQKTRNEINDVRNIVRNQQIKEEIYKERVSRPIIKQTRVSFYLLDEPNEFNQSSYKNMYDSSDRENKKKDLLPQQQVLEWKQSSQRQVSHSGFQNSLLPRRNVENRGQEIGFWDGLIRKMF